MAGTEDGIKEPQATFSACFGAAFIMMHPTRYAAMLAEKMQKHGATGWLVNTGWSGGRYGNGSRIKLPYTRRIIDAIHSGSLLEAANYNKTEVFGLEIPTEVEGVPSEILDPINTVSKLDLSFINQFSCSFDFTSIIFLILVLCAVVRQEGLQGYPAEACWSIQEEFRDIHQLQNRQGQQID